VKFSELTTQTLEGMAKTADGELAGMVRDELRARGVAVAVDKPSGEKAPHHQRTDRFAGLDRGAVRQRGVMNGTERKYADELETQRLAGEIASWKFEAMKLRLSSPAEGVRAIWLTIDFLVVEADGSERLDEVKGSGPDNDASIVRLKTAAELYPHKRIRLVKRQPKAAGGGWKITEL
jgi:hypothetical protein